MPYLKERLLGMLIFIVAFKSLDEILMKFDVA